MRWSIGEIGLLARIERNSHLVELSLNQANERLGCRRIANLLSSNLDPLQKNRVGYVDTTYRLHGSKVTTNFVAMQTKLCNNFVGLYLKADRQMFCTIHNSDMQERFALGRKVREWRKSKGLGQKQVADHVGVNAQTISNLETGATRRLQSYEEMKKLAELMGLPVEELFIAADELDPGPTAEDVLILIEKLSPLEAERFAKLLWESGRISQPHQQMELPEGAPPMKGPPIENKTQRPRKP